MQKYFAELIGSFFLILALGLTGNALASGLLLIPLLYIGGQISGAHYNPAVTVAFWAARGMPVKKLAGYLLFQLAGALSGAILLYLLAGYAYHLSPSATSTPFQYSAVEVIFSMLFCLVYLVMFATRIFNNNTIYGLVIGFTFAGILLVAKPISGGVVNPSIATASAVVDLFDFGESYLYLPVYILAPVVGGLIAGNLFKFLFRNDLNQPQSPAGEA